MNYVWYYSAASLFYLSVTAIFYLRRRRVHNVADRIYTAMLWLALGACLFDSLTAIVEPYASAWPRWLLVAINFANLAFIQACLPAFLLHIRATAGELPWRKISNLPSLLPFFITMALLVLGLFTPWGIFYLDESNYYTFGATHLALYVDSAIYLCWGCLVLARRRRQMAKTGFWSIVFFCGVIILAIGLQLAMPRYLLTVTATAMGVMVLSFVLQPPDDYLDPTTQVFDRRALPELLSEKYRQAAPFAVVLYTLRNHGLIDRTLGARIGDRLLLDAANALQSLYPQGAVIRLEYAKFVVLAAGLPQPDSVPALPHSWLVYGAAVEMGSSRAMLRSPDFPEVGDMLGMLDYLTNIPPDDSKVLLADSRLLARSRQAGAQAEALSQALAADSFTLGWQLILSQGRPWAIAARLFPTDPELADLDADQLTRLAAAANQPAALTERLLTHVAAVLRHNPLLAPLPGEQSGYGAGGQDGADGSEQTGAVPHVLAAAAAAAATPPLCLLVELPLAQCLREGVGEKLCAVAAAADLPPERICFLLRDYVSDVFLPTVEKNVARLAREGFHLGLDRFGSGYVNFASIRELNCVCVRLDAELARLAQADGQRRVLLEGLCHILRDLSVPILCQAAPHYQLPADARQPAPTAPWLNQAQLEAALAELAAE